MFRKITLLALVLVLAQRTVGTAVAAEVEVTYLANEGFLISSDEHKVLIDALFPGLDNYASVPEPTRSRLERGEPPFDGVDLVLATHFHADHFGELEVARFLEASPAMFVSTPDASSRLRAALGDDALPEGAAHYPGEGREARLDLPGIELTILNLHHGRNRRPPVQNLGFIVTIGGVSVLHVGDTEASVEDVRPYRMGERGIDVAILPSWFYGSARWQGVIDEIGARRLIVMHLATPKAPGSWFGSAGSRERWIEQIRSSYPEVWIPTEVLESRRFASAAGRMPAAR